MDRLERLNLFKEKGFTYNPETGDIISNLNNIIKGKDMYGYIQCILRVGKQQYKVKGHQLAYFLHYGVMVPEYIDHINLIKDDNRIENLRHVTEQW